MPDTNNKFRTNKIYFYLFSFLPLIPHGFLMKELTKKSLCLFARIKSNQNNKCFIPKHKHIEMKLSTTTQKTTEVSFLQQKPLQEHHSFVSDKQQEYSTLHTLYNYQIRLLLRKRNEFYAG